MRRLYLFPLGLVIAAHALAATTAPPEVGTPAPKPPAAAAAQPAKPANLDWEELIPATERSSYSATPPPPTHDYLSGESGLAAQQPMNFAVNPKLEGRLVRIPGFIVPLELDAAGKVVEFFLVPYFGACIHVPPPPPNQMLYVTMPQGLTLESMYAAYWVSGRLATRTQKTKLGAAAYSLAASGVEEYKY